MNFIYKAATVAGLMGQEGEVKQKYFEHIEEFNLNYATQEEHEFRYQIFSQKHMQIENHNLGNHSFTLGHNKFSTWSADEMDRILAKKA